ncbi:hypothetical protein HKX48_002875 [Thoreauomyces humboldtii]|nr:hypothetical protein HKX48_002875 [Thoreauomyces humboldtii]
MSRFLGWAWLPALAALFWFATILVLLALWGSQSAPVYKRDEANIVYISDVGANYKTVFICGCSLTSFFFLSSLVADLLLRRGHRLAEHRRTRELIYSIASIIFGLIACVALVGLSVFDAFNHAVVHWTLTGVFIVGLAISAIFTTAEFRSLRHDRGKSNLTRSFLAKCILLGFAVFTVILMGSLMAVCRGRTNWRGTPDATKCNAAHSGAAVCEWVVALIFVGYLCTLVADLRQSVYTSAAHQQGHDWRRDSSRTVPVGGDGSC